MSHEPPTLLPLHALLEALDAWQASTKPAARRRVKQAFERVVTAYRIGGAHLQVRMPGLPDLVVGCGSLTRRPRRTRPGITQHTLRVDATGFELGDLWLDGDPQAVALAARVVGLSLDAAWSRAKVRATERRFAALDAAVREIANVLDVERVLQLIVDRVRELVGAQYAALGIVGPFGDIERFITSGMSEEQRKKIGDLPRGRGLLGLIIREDRSFRIDDISSDPRRAGFPPRHPVMHSFLGVPVRSEGRSIGNLYLTNKLNAATFSDDDQRLVEMFALHAGIAIRNARLHEEVQRLAVLEERDRISQDLHDGVIQSLYGVALSLEDLPEVIAEEPSEGTIRLDRAIDAIHQIIRDIRNFIMGLRPELLDEADLATGLQSLAAEFRLNTMIDLEVQVDEPLPELQPEAAAHLLAMTREGLSNIARHSAATRASLDLDADDGMLHMIIGDNGRGFDLAEARGKERHGLANLRSRAEAMGGSLTVHSEPSVGTRLEARIPTIADAETSTRKAADGN